MAYLWCEAKLDQFNPKAGCWFRSVTKEQDCKISSRTHALRAEHHSRDDHRSRSNFVFHIKVDYSPTVLGSSTLSFTFL